MTNETPVTVYYDGACPLCRREINHYRTCRGGDRIAWVDVSQDAAPAADLDRTAALKRFHVRDADGRLVSGAAGFLALWRALPGFSLLARLLSLPPFPLLLEGGYRVFLKIRPPLSAALKRAEARSG